MANIDAQTSPHGWSTTAANNGNQAPPDGFAALQNPSQLYSWIYETMRSVRTRYNDAEWVA